MTVASSKPDELKSSLIDHFPEAGVSLPYMTFSEDRPPVSTAFTWISEREARENSRLRKFIDSGKRFEKDTFEKDDILQTVKKTIATITGFDGLFDDREQSEFTVRKPVGGKEDTLLFSQLSSGEQHLISFAAAIAVFLADNCPDIPNPMNGEALFLIDAIELHLHPSWQRDVIPKLTAAFPNCQFVITTHSPQVLNHVKPESVFVMQRTGDDVSIQKPDESFGMSLDRVVELIMDDESRPLSVQNDLDTLFELIERGKTKEADGLLKRLNVDMPTDPELLRAKMLLRRRDLKSCAS